MNETTSIKAVKTQAVVLLNAFIDSWRGAPWHRQMSNCLLLAALAFSSFFLGVTVASPIVDDYHFRQSQTAISIYYAVRESSWIAYQTPVLGLPWSAPFEGPVYQIVVATLVSATGLDIVPAARLVTYSFFLGTIYFGHRILRLILPGDRMVSVIFSILMLTCPLYLFWGRSTLIETSAIFFGAWWLYLAIRAAEEGNFRLAAISTFPCVLAVLAKVTTWPAFVVTYGIYWVARRVKGGPPPWTITMVLGGGVAMSLATCFWWLNFSDAIKSTGEITRLLTSSNLESWNFGTPEDRLSAVLWMNTFPWRMLPDILGALWLVTLFLPSRLDLRSTHFCGSMAAIGLFFVGIILFTNLHVIHAYYQSSNALFLIAAIAIVLSGLMAKGYVRISMILLVILICGQFFRFVDWYWPKATRDFENDPKYQVAKFVRENTFANNALVVIGLDWSSVVHFYAQRKGLAMPNWIPKEVLIKFLERPSTLFGNLPVGAVVHCTTLQPRQEVENLIKRYLEVIAEEAAAGGKTAVFGPCTAYIGPNAGPP